MFKNVKTVKVTPTKTAGKGSKKPTDEIKGWEEVAALDMAAKAVTALAEIKKTAMRDGPVKDALVERGICTQGKPESLSPVEGDGKGSAYLSKRSTNSPMKPDELDLLAEVVGKGDVDDDGVVINVPGYTQRIEAMPSLLAVNPEHAGNQELLDKVEKACSRIKGFPDNFIIRTEAEAKTVVSDEALNNLFKLDENAVGVLLPLLATIALRPVYGAGLEKAWTVIRKLLPEAEAAMQKAAEAEKAAKAAKRAPAGNPRQTLGRQLRASLAQDQPNAGA